MNNVGRYYAKKLKSQLSLTEPPFLPETAFGLLNIEYQLAPLEGCLGIAIHDPESGKSGVIVSSNIAEEGKIHFTGAHELGHLSIPSHSSQTQYECTANDFKYWNNKGLDQKELEANDFAAEWLMPEDLFKEILPGRVPDFEFIIQLSIKFSTSIMATAMRVVDLCDKDIMLVVSNSETHKMNYFRKKDNFPYYIDWGIVPNTYVRNPKKGKVLPSEYMAVSSDEWFRGWKQPKSGEVLELSMKLTDYPTTLTLLLVEC